MRRPPRRGVLVPQDRLHLECVELGTVTVVMGSLDRAGTGCVGWVGWGGVPETDLGPEDLSIFSRMRSSTHNVKMKTGAPDDCRHSPSSRLEIASAGRVLWQVAGIPSDKVWAVCEKAGEKLWGWGQSAPVRS